MALSSYWRKERQAMLERARRIADKEGLSKVTRARVAKEAGCSPALVSRYWEMDELLDALWRLKGKE